jgi:pyruvate formate lyase activating enzyme
MSAGFFDYMHLSHFLFCIPKFIRSSGTNRITKNVLKFSAMEGMVYDIKRFALHDGPGIRTTVFFKGCPLQCMWCHNPESCLTKPETIVKKQTLDNQSFCTREIVGKRMSVDEVMQVINKEAVFYDESAGGVTLSGGEPLMQSCFAVKILKACKESGYHTAIDTSGYAKWESLFETAEYCDLFLYDLKHYDSARHKESTGVPNHLILKNLEKLIKLKRAIRVRIPVVPKINNSPDDFEAFIELLKKLNFKGQVDLLPFHNLANAKYQKFQKENKLSGQKNMNAEELLPAKEMFENNGFQVKIGG